MEGWPVDLPALIKVRGRGFLSHVEGRGEGCQRLLNALSADAILSSCMSTSYPVGKGLDEVKLALGGLMSEEGVEDSTVAEKPAPVVPELFPPLGSRSHDAMGCRNICISEKTSEQSFVLG